jgi:DNA repair photolyase
MTSKAMKKTKTLFGTKEWAEKNENLISGCSHDCKYCYAKTILIRMKRKNQFTWSREVLNQNALSRNFRKRKGTIMYPSSHDITPQHLKENMMHLERILAAGNKVLIVSKPHLECVKSMCNAFNPFKENILFRFTIGSADSNTLKFWEPNAPDFDERLESLKCAFNAGYQTSISCEPMLDTGVDQVVEKVLPYVTETIWLGKPNKLNERLSMNGYKNDKLMMERARRLIESLSDGFIFNIYERYGDNSKIMWKDSIKKVVGIEVSTKVGADV